MGTNYRPLLNPPRAERAQRAGDNVEGSENGRVWSARPKISAHDNGKVWLPFRFASVVVPRRHVQPECLGEEQTADVECTKHVPVPHAMPVLLTMVMVVHIVLELGSDVLGTPSTYHPFFSAP